MSKKRRRRPPVRQTPQEVKKEQTAARDGFTNSLAYLGEASPLSEANDFVRHQISTDYNTLTIAYRENWLAARIIDTPCEDMTRSWYSLSSEIDQERLDQLQKLEAKHSVKQEITNAIRWGRLYGGAAAVIVIKGQEDMLDQPLDYDMLQPGCFRGLIVIDKVRGIFPSIELEEDMDDPEFGYPKYYQVTMNEESGEMLLIHHSRLLIFKGRQLPIDEEIMADYWGASELEHVYEELQKRNASSANIAQLIFQANVATLGISDYGEVMGMGTQQQREQVYKYVTEMNRLRTSFGIALMSAEDKYEQHPYSFAGVAEVYEAFMMDIAGASEIPATKLFGRAPQGMNSTGESDMKNYYEVISQLQERVLRPALEKLLPVMCMSVWGEVPEDLEIVFEPIGTTTPAERAEIMGQSSTPVIQAFQAGIISQKVALSELRELGKPINAWTNITDEDIENADDEADMGEEMQDPMAAMMGGQVPPEAQAGFENPEEAQVQPEVDADKLHELKERVKALREAQVQLEPEEDIENLGPGTYPPPDDEGNEQFPERVHRLKERVKNILKTQEGREHASEAGRIAKLRERIARLRGEEAEDGGPGSGPRPGYHKKSAGLSERVNFMANPTAGMPEPTRTRPTAESVKKANSERKEWSNLTLHQKVAGNAEQNRHIHRVKNEVRKAALRGDLEKARRIVKENRHYWANDPDSAMKTQSETLKRQKAQGKSFLNQLVGRFRGSEDGGPGSGNFGHAGRPGKQGGSAPEGGGSGSPIDNTPQTAYNGKATKGWKGLKAKLEVSGPRMSKGYIDKYLADHPDVAQNVQKYMDIRRKVNDFVKDHPEAENYNTYDAETGQVKDIDSGFCVTFHQNNTADDPLGAYSDKDYAAMCAIAANELGADGVNIGYYGNPEVSFVCNDETAAKEFAVRHNQQSVYNASTGRTLVNKQWDMSTNPIRL